VLTRYAPEEEIADRDGGEEEREKRKRERERKETNDFCQNGQKTFRTYCSFESAVAE